MQHNPALNLAPLGRWTLRELGIPVVYEVRAFWEDAAVDHGTTREGSLRYRATRAFDTHVFGQVDHVFTICEGLRSDIRRNLEREVRFRLQARNKQAALDALVSVAELDLPNASVQTELQRLIESARADLKQRGVKDSDKAPIPGDLFRPQAERRVRLGLVVAELVRAHDLKARPEQIKAHVDELAASYEKPAEVVRWYYSDNKRMSEVEAIVIENNVTEFILASAQPTEKAIEFDALMGQG